MHLFLEFARELNPTMIDIRRHRELGVRKSECVLVGVKVSSLKHN